MGDIPDSGVYRLLPDPISLSAHELRLRDFKATAAVWNRRHATRLKYRAWADSAAAAEDRAVAERSAKERAKGLIRGPFLSVDALHNAVRAFSPPSPPRDT